MSLNATDEQLYEDYILALEERAKPSKNDIRLERYVNYVNCFISKFGEERVHLVGSTSERSKLAFSKDDGDADFLLVSGKLEIPVENIVPDKKAPCYVWIRADALSRDIGLEIVEDEYISANTLREVRPELFTILRAIYLHVTATVNKLPETDTARTVLSVSSKVGIQTTAYRSLKFDENIEDLKTYFRNNKNIKRVNEREKLLSNRWKMTKVGESEKKIYRRIYEASKLAVPSNRKNNNGGIAFFVQLVEEIFDRHKGDSPITDEDYSDDKLTISADDIYQDHSSSKDITYKKKKVLKATYTEKNHKDFVPALVIKGKLEVMRQWKKRTLSNGLEEDIVNDIYDTEIFVVSRASPNTSNSEKDFCMSFNLAERKLMTALSTVKRRVYLILKAFLKGVFENKHKQDGKELRLTTYHIKTLLFWHYEQNEKEDTRSVLNLTDSALVSLLKKFDMKELPHYFVPSSNLFVDFEQSDYQILRECVKEVRDHPAKSLEYYINLNNVERSEIWFTEEDMDCFWGMSDDGGRSEQRNKLEEAMLDFQRGLDDMRNREGYPPLKEAVLDTIALCLRDDTCNDLSRFETIDMILTKGDSKQLERSNDVEQLLPIRGTAGRLCFWVCLRFICSVARLRLLLPVVSFFLSCCSFNSKIKGVIDKYGGKRSFLHILRGAYCGKRLNFKEDIRQQILETIQRYLTCPDAEADATCSELKYKLAGYFLCKREFFDDSGIRRV